MSVWDWRYGAPQSGDRLYGRASLNLDVTDPERLGQSRIDLGKPTREVLLSYLVRLLLQPSTPSDTDEDEEGEQPRTPSAFVCVRVFRRVRM